MLMGTSLWFEGHQARGLEHGKGKGFGDDFSMIDDVMMEDRLLSWTASARANTSVDYYRPSHIVLWDFSFE
jgi:hypothetical protein